MEQENYHPTFDQVIQAGFKRQEANDDVFERQHGYPYFLVNFEAENFIIEWDIDSHELKLSVCYVPIEVISLQKAMRIIYEYRTKSKED